MIDTKAIRERFVGVRHVEPWVVPVLCIEVDGTRALLAEAEARLAAAEARAERLAQWVRANRAYWAFVHRNAIVTEEDTSRLMRHIKECHEASNALQPGDLGEETE